MTKNSVAVARRKSEKKDAKKDEKRGGREECPRSPRQKFARRLSTPRGLKSEPAWKMGRKGVVIADFAAAAAEVGYPRAGAVSLLQLRLITARVELVSFIGQSSMERIVISSVRIANRCQTSTFSSWVSTEDPRPDYLEPIVSLPLLFRR